MEVELLFCLALFCIVVSPIFASNPDKISSLPGLKTKLHFQQYSGYLNGTRGRKLHYWFAESEGSPKSDPLLLWLNGGPGCSSLFGLLGENGPIHVNDDGRTVFVNPYRWNKFSNVLYLEAPAGVGFSYSDDKNYATDDDHVAEDNYAALQNFFVKFPSFKKNDFYITGESYAGIYVPTLAVKVLNGPAKIAFKGFVIGNGFMDPNLNGESLIFFGFYHGLFGASIWDRLSKFCCKNNVTRETCQFINSKNTDCAKAVNDASHFISNIGLNTYNLYQPCIKTSTKNNTSRYQRDFALIKESLNISNIASISDTIECVNDSRVAAWLNLPQTRQALHIPDNVQSWAECSNDVAKDYRRVYDTMKPQFQTLLSSGRLRGLVYNGDVDMSCNFLGDQWFVEDLGLKVTAPWREWTYSDQVAGFLKRFQNLSFITIKGSGHMVPQDKPAEALALIGDFLKGNI